MMYKLLSEIEGIETVDAMREALRDVPGDMRLCDVVGEALRLAFYEDEDTGEKALTVN
ncbi:hypothetical protein [Syntrophotalea acetylenica]|uniref:hypothetical protein n=1 Tax=Syntrophotalea acetylenica TaxID=29542 RepID=UPI002A35D53F|nr:hypothetical protein [Syntrophotalea acetylenica]MDY0262003.1 hypothetical protein [Syntrophotalea acetylenica]